MNKITSLFRDDDHTGNERKYYFWLKAYFQESAYTVYPNVALQVIINADSLLVKKELSPKNDWIESLQMQWCTQNFFENSSVDLCVIQKSDYLPVVALEIDAESHLNARQKKKDEFKDLLFAKARLPLLRLKVYKDQLDAEKEKQFAEAISTFIRENPLVAKTANVIQGKRSILFGADIEGYFDLLKRMFQREEYLVFPHLGAEDVIDYRALSKYELGRNEPPLLILLQYARIVGVHMEEIVDDDLELPSTLRGSKERRALKRSVQERKRTTLRRS